MPDLEAQRDERLAQALEEARVGLRERGAMDLPILQARYPELAHELPQLVETISGLDRALALCRAPGASCQATPVGAETVELVPAPEPKRFGRYLILGILGQGGMGSVYRGRDPKLERTVAIKVPHFKGREQAQEAARKRFLREAQAAAAIRHPHVCAIFDVGEDDGVPYVVMDFLAGGSLDQRIPQTGIADCRQAVLWVRQIAEALEAVHAHGIIHRDLKPANILFNEKGHAVLTDFGLARPDQAGENLTADGAVLGTPAYMAPEQASLTLGPVGPWSDLFSLGVVLYKMVAGRTPFAETRSAVSLLYQVAHETPPPPRQFRKDLDENLQAIIHKAISRKPEDRFTNAREFADALEGWLENKSGPKSPAVRLKKPRLGKRAARWLAVAAALILVAAAIFYARPWQSDNTDPAPRSVANVRLGVVSWDLELYKPGKGTDIHPLGTLEAPGATLPRKNDRFSFKAQFSEPAYPYLVAVNPDGSRELLHPEKGTSVQPVKEFRFPDSGNNYPYFDQEGFQALVLVVTRNELPAFQEWQPRVDPQAWKRSETEAAWKFDGERISPMRTERVVLAPHGPPALSNLLTALQKLPDLAALRILAFPVKPAP